MPSTDPCVPLYERLRQGVLEGHTVAGPFGLAILLREGVAAWVACHDAAPVTPTRATTQPQPRMVPPPCDRMARDMVTVWTNMITATPEDRRA